MFPEVVVQQTSSAEWVALSHEAAVVGETLVLDVVPADAPAGAKRQRFFVSVVESQPVIVDGDVRYKIRLQDSDREAVLFEQQIRRG